MQCHGDPTNATAAGASCVDLAVASWTPKPIVMDEVRYEGNISAEWGALSAADETQRFWLFFAKGAHTGHSECILPAAWTSACTGTSGYPPGECACSPNMWWNHGGALNGGAARKLAFFRTYVDALPVDFSTLTSIALAPGVFWLSAPNATFSFVLWDASMLAAPVRVLVPLPAARAFRLRSVDYEGGAFADLGTRDGPIDFTPPTAGFALELVVA